MRYYYAIISAANICLGVINTYAPIEDNLYIPIEFYDESLIGKLYNNGEWEEMPIPEEPIT